MKKLFFPFMPGIAIIAIMSCGQSTTTEQKTETSATPSPQVASKVAPPVSNNDETDNGVDFMRSDASEKAFEALKNMDKFKGKPIMVFQTIHWYDDKRIEVSLADPVKADNVDHYTYRNGSWGEPEPVQITGNGKIGENLVNLDEINYKALPDMMKTADEKAKSVEGGKTSNHAYFTFSPAFNTKTFLVGVDGTREKYTLKFDKDGKLKETSKN